MVKFNFNDNFLSVGLKINDKYCMAAAKQVLPLLAATLK